MGSPVRKTSPGPNESVVVTGNRSPMLVTASMMPGSFTCETASVCTVPSAAPHVHRAPIGDARYCQRW